MRKRELQAAGCLTPDTVAQAAALYDIKDLTGTEEAIRKVLQDMVGRNGKENTYFDFYYGTLLEEEQQRVRASLTPEEAAYLQEVELSGEREEVYFPYEQRLFDIALKLSLNNCLFSTFYFSLTKETVWSNYDRRFLVFSEKAEEKRLPDNHEECLKYYELVLERHEIGPEDIKQYALPDGYRFVFYRPGDKSEWIHIEISARELIDEQEGEEIWEQYYGGKEAKLSERMIFVEDMQGRKVATATAFYEPRDTSGAGWLHWVAVSREAQGRGLARPLISRALIRLTELGYTSIKIPTQTTSWVAAKLYMDFGFRAIPENAVNSHYGYRIMKTLTNHPSLEGIEPLDYGQIWDEEMLALEERLRTVYPEMAYFCMRQKDGRRTVFCRTGTGVERLDYAQFMEGDLYG